MIKGFRDFISRGNVIDLAVAVVIGAAFTAIIDSIVKGIINPLIALFFNAKDLDKVMAGPFLVGSVLSALINFIAVALIVYFVFVYPMNAFKERQAKKAGVPDPAEEPALSEQQLLTQIRDLLEKQQQS